MCRASPKSRRRCVRPQLRRPRGARSLTRFRTRRSIALTTDCSRGVRSRSSIFRASNSGASVNVSASVESSKLEPPTDPGLARLSRQRGRTHLLDARARARRRPHVGAGRGRSSSYGSGAVRSEERARKGNAVPERVSVARWHPAQHVRARARRARLHRAETRWGGDPSRVEGLVVQRTQQPSVRDAGREQR